MKRTLTIVFAFTSVITMAQPKKTSPVKATPQTILKTRNDSLSYAIGISVASFYKEQGVTEVNVALVSKAINDALKKGKPIMSDQQCNGVIMDFIQKVKSEKALSAKKEGLAFLEKNRAQPGVVTLPDGLQYLIIKEGDGPKPALTDKVKCHYHGTLIDGTVFDSSIDRGQPIDFQVNGVIPGWTEALQLMPVGSKWRLFIPSSLAYGDQAAGKIKPGSTLIFDVELLAIEKQ